MPEAWNALKGWYKVMQILRQNIVLIVAIVGLIAYVTTNASISDLLKWLIP